ncbi:MAG TPA: sigma-70 factor domain-containing protein, partial [Bellilinea sp.]|nr:sigma-70 factor domain-containing protein [Bellilinea sp.]
MVSKDEVRRRKRTKSAEEIDVVDVDDIVKMYVREAARVPLLTADEEVELAQRIERGRMAPQELAKGGVSQHRVQELRKLIEDGLEAHERLVHANSRLVISVAKKYMGRGLPFLD